MWTVLLNALIALAGDVLLPALLKWLGLIETALNESAAAKKLLRANQPQNHGEFAKLLPQLLEAALADAKLTKAQKIKAQLLVKVITTDEFSRALWNKMALDQKLASLTLPLAKDVGHAALINACRD